MTIGDRLAVTESLIYSFAKDLFDSNGIPYSLSHIVMQAVTAKFQEGAINEMLSELMQGGQVKPVKEETKTGTKEDLIKEFAENVGFFPDEPAPAADLESGGDTK